MIRGFPKTPRVQARICLLLFTQAAGAQQENAEPKELHDLQSQYVSDIQEALQR